LNVPQLELVCFTTIRLMTTDRPSIPWRSTELAAIFKYVNNLVNGDMMNIRLE